jgi:glyoxylase I family protein
MKKFLLILGLPVVILVSVVGTLFATGQVGVTLHDPDKNRILHHVALNAKNMDETLRFYTEGIGLKVLLDMELEGDFPAVFNARGNKLHSIFLGDPDQPDAGIVELVAFEGGHADRPDIEEPTNGFSLISFVTDVHETVARLQSLGFAPNAIVQAPIPGNPSDIAVIRDPDGVIVELIPFAFYARPMGK